MGTQIAVRGTDHQVPKGSKLAKLEYELAVAMAENYESFCRQGAILFEISKGAYKDAGYTSFNDYCDERQPLGLKRSHAKRLIAAMKIRPMLPDFEAPEGASVVWSEKAVRPLTHSDFTPADVRRLGKRIASAVKRGEKLSETLVKRLCDEDRGVARITREKKDKAFQEADSPAQVLRRLKVDIELWQSSLAEVPADFWSDAETDDPGCLKRAIGAISKLASFLAS